MSKWIVVSDNLHAKLKEQKGNKSFARYIEDSIDKGHKIDTIGSLIQDIASLKNRMDSIEQFLKDKSGGQY